LSLSELRIATRESPLALWQAEHVQARLESAHPGLRVTLVPMTTRGDQLLSDSLAASGGKGLFVKELELALLNGRADIAVHSMKDVPAKQPEGLQLIAFLAGEDPRDALVSERFANLDELPEGAHVGTASLRRQALLKINRPDLRISMLRGNVGSRLKRLDDGQFDAILLASAGLKRLGLASRITQALDVGQFVPAIGQGIVGIEAREGDEDASALLAKLNDQTSEIRLGAERALNARLGGACTVPVAGHAVVQDGQISLDAMVGAPDGSRHVRQSMQGPAQDAARIGTELAEQLIAMGARDILGALGIIV
tara:strand:+ start:9734 stop:10666 length:933 start_codon:yes stop_codon:yes gene_type:complete